MDSNERLVNALHIVAAELDGSASLKNEILSLQRNLSYAKEDTNALRVEVKLLRFNLIVCEKSLDAASKRADTAETALTAIRNENQFRMSW